jgi:spore maturation protein CgeB
MKICFLTQYYPDYIRSFYSRYPLAANLPYEEQLQEIIKDNFDWISALLCRVKNLGHDVHIIIANAEPLQQAWARENGVSFDLSNWQFTIPFEQIKGVSPDIFWIDSIFQYYGEYLTSLKKYCRYIFAWTATAYPDNLDLSSVDCMLTSHSHFAKQFRDKGEKCEILLPCFEPLILERISKQTIDPISFSFVGGLSPLHIHRTEVISKLVEQTDLEIWGYQRSVSRNIFVDYRKLMYALNSMLKYRKISSRHRGAAWGLDMYKILRESSMTLNIHAEVANNISGNIRLFEATGVGSLLFTESTDNLKSMFIPGEEVETYSSYDELLEKVQYYSVHHQERDAIAKAGQSRTMNHHSTVQRSQEWLNIISKYCVIP